MKLIAAVDKNWAIGYRGQLLVSIPGDQRFFRSETMNKVVVLGRKTMDTFPGGRPLKNRRNIILTHDKNYHIIDAETANSVDELLSMTKDIPTDDIYIIGGESVYRQFLPYCDTAYVTKIDYAYSSDAFFPNLDADEEWEQVYESDEQTYYDVIYTFCTYKRK